MIRQLAHICIHARDLDETARYYFDALGLEKGFEFKKDDALIGYYIKLGHNTFIEVFKGTPGDPGNIAHVSLETDNLDELIQRIRKHGYEATDKKLGADSSWQSWSTDPNGVRIEFHEYTPESRQIIGGTCMVFW